MIGGGLLAGAAYIAWQLMKHLRQSFRSDDQGPQPPAESGDEPGNGADKQAAESREAVRPQDPNKLIERIVSEIEFSHGGKTHVELQPSEIPADDINVRPMMGFSEIPRILRSEHALEDETFFAKAATGQLSVVEHLAETVVEEPAGKAVIEVLDCSGSMKEYNRSRWARRLSERLVGKCIDHDADYALITFSDQADCPHQASGRAKLEELQRALGSIVYHNGGTHIDLAFRACFELLKELGLDDIKILLVTDGTEGFDVEWVVSSLAKLGAKLHTVVLGQQRPDLRAVSWRYHEILDESLVSY
ncbi:MAG: VWA domain-containing protein [Candidatus Buchananbacteria bacterium]|nr:VWA domain-containing protein [Candidatus Buchananbacteria bacterium]